MRDSLRAWVKNWANNDDIPDKDMELFLDAAENAIAANPALQSESLGDWSASYREQLPLQAVATCFLGHHRRVKTL